MMQGPAAAGACSTCERRHCLDMYVRGRYRRRMAQFILVFDFGTNENAAQQARRKVDGWKQGFRLGDKITLKFEREDVESNGDAPEKASAKLSKKTGAMKKDADANGNVKVLVKLAFSDHEKISQQRWLDRIPTEEPFKSAKGTSLKEGEEKFAETSDLFDSLD